MNGHIVTITLNPAIDETVELDHLALGAVNRATNVTRNAGGKGVNVAACLADWGHSVQVSGFLGRANRTAFESLFADKPRLTNHFFMLDGTTRDNIKIVSRDTGDTTDVNLPGFSAQASDLQALTAFVESEVFHAGRHQCKIAVLAGSVPAGLPANAWQPLLRIARQAGYYLVLDTSGDALKSVLNSNTAIPQVLKPNRHELEEWAGRPLLTHADLLGTARELVARKAELVVVSMGGEGAMFVNAEQALLARPPRVEVRSSVGAGDAMVAGIVAGLMDKLPLPEIAKRATGFAAAKLPHIGPHLPDVSAVSMLADATEVTLIIE